MTVRELAEKLNVSRSAVAKWETDNGTPEISNLKLISKMFSISLDDLLNDECQITYLRRSIIIFPLRNC